MVPMAAVEEAFPNPGKALPVDAAQVQQQEQCRCCEACLTQTSLIPTRYWYSVILQLLIGSAGREVGRGCCGSRIEFVSVHATAADLTLREGTLDVGRSQSGERRAKSHRFTQTKRRT